MQSVSLIDGSLRFAGAVSLDVTDDGVLPARYRVDWRELYEPLLLSRADMPAGVRATFVSDTNSVVMRVRTRPADASFDVPWVFDLCVDGEMFARAEPGEPGEPGGDEATVRFDGLPVGEHLIELYLPTQYIPVRVRSVQIDDGATLKPWDDPRPKWLVYGSSITQCRHAAGPTESWPAIVARRCGLNMTCLGYGGNDQIEPILAMTMRELPANYISLCCGGNSFGQSTYSSRTFRATMLGFMLTIREGHPTTPMVVCTCVHFEEGGKPNKVDLTLDDYADMIRDAVATLQQRGDDNLFIHEGKQLFGKDDLHLLADTVHPNAEGYRLMGNRYVEQVMPKFGLSC
jgi:hypothetical protein